MRIVIFANLQNGMPHLQKNKQHQLLIILLLVMFSILGSIPRFDVTMNYVTWFGVIYLIASYIWFYQNKITFFVSDSNKIFAVLVAVSSFLYFKNLDIRHSRISYHPCVGALEVDFFCK